MAAIVIPIGLALEDLLAVAIAAGIGTLMANEAVKAYDELKRKAARQGNTAVVEGNPSKDCWIVKGKLNNCPAGLSCKDFVIGYGRTKNDAIAKAKSVAPQACRAYYKHFEVIKRGKF